jgi:hypothetical protein
MSFITEALVLREEKRLTLETVIRERQKTLFAREFTYYQGKHPAAALYSGFVKGEGEKMMFHHIGDVLYPNASQYKGALIDSKKSGYGASYNGNNQCQIGFWQNDALASGALIKKGAFIYLGGIADGKPNGKGIFILLHSNQPITTVLLFDGDFSGGQKTNGTSRL